MSGFFHQSVRNDLNNPGGYKIYLTNSFSETPSSGGYLGFLRQTSSTAEGWLEYSFALTLTEVMADLSFLIFAPTGTRHGAYPGLDNVSLVGPTVPATSAVPVPAAAWLFGSALLGFFGFSRRKAIA